MAETKYKGGGENVSKVVAHLRDGKLVKGYFEAVVGSAEQLLRQKAPSLPREIPVRPAEAQRAVQIPLESLKALFFVKTFEGRQNYSDIKFFKGQPAIEGLWVGVKFFDGERTEGIVHNSIHHLMEPGFFLKPPDPNSNNELMYVLKSSLTEFRVLAVTTTY